MGPKKAGTGKTTEERVSKKKQPPAPPSPDIDPDGNASNGDRRTEDGERNQRRRRVARATPSSCRPRQQGVQRATTRGVRGSRSSASTRRERQRAAAAEARRWKYVNMTQCFHNKNIPSLCDKCTRAKAAMTRGVACGQVIVTEALLNAQFDPRQLQVPPTGPSGVARAATSSASSVGGVANPEALPEFSEWQLQGQWRGGKGSASSSSLGMRDSLSYATRALSSAAGSPKGSNVSDNFTLEELRGTGGRGGYGRGRGRP